MSENALPGDGEPVPPTSRRLLRKDERRVQLTRAAAGAFLERGFAGTSLEDVAAEAGVTKMIIYWHFDSKRDLYQAVLVDAREQLTAYIGPPEEYGPDTLRTMVLAASENPDGFRLLYQHALREPEFAGYVTELSDIGRCNTETGLRDVITDSGRLAWIGILFTAFADAILAWLDAGQPVSPDELNHRIGAAMRALMAPDPTPSADQ